uniref:Uncharacterized protein n=2 Tax=Caenorhabditis tropicalis TaxID=1561998 RepID=A0A1I7TP96_9PELO
MDVRFPPYFFAMPHLIYNSWLNLNTLHNAPKLAQLQLESIKTPESSSKIVKKEVEKVEEKSEKTEESVEIIKDEQKKEDEISEEKEEKIGGQMEDNDVSLTVVSLIRQLP